MIPAAPRPTPTGGATETLDAPEPPAPSAPPPQTHRSRGLKRAVAVARGGPKANTRIAGGYP